MQIKWVPFSLPTCCTQRFQAYDPLQQWSDLLLKISAAQTLPRSESFPVKIIGNISQHNNLDNSCSFSFSIGTCQFNNVKAALSTTKNNNK